MLGKVLECLCHLCLKYAGQALKLSRERSTSAAIAKNVAASPHCSACTGMDHLQSQRLEVAKAIKEEEAEKLRIEQDMAVLQSRLAHIKESLQKKVGLSVHAFCLDVAGGLQHCRSRTCLFTD